MINSFFLDGKSSFGQCLKRRRKALDLTQTQLAQRMGYSAITLRKIEADRLRPSQQFAGLLAKVLYILPEEYEAFIAFARGSSKNASVTSTALSRNVPLPLSTFIGRNIELQAVVTRLVAPTTRLLTLTGAPGIGKTRFAIQVARQVASDFGDGLAFVDLSLITDPAEVARTVAQVFRLRENSTQTPLERLIHLLGRKHLLLVLDNCEQVKAACAQLVELLCQNAPLLKIMTTGREVLGVHGEIIWTVAPLTVPVSIRGLKTESLLSYEAMQLFIARVRDFNPQFALNDQNASALTYICQQLDGLPLAIELAAMRVSVLSIEQIASRLDERFELLQWNTTAITNRHQNLRLLVDWSYELLTESERFVLRQLAIFAASATLDAVRAVVTSAEYGIAENDVIGLLASLISKSLIVVEEYLGEMRYGLLETIRHYAMDKLIEHGEVAPAQHRHFVFFLNWAEAAALKLHTADQLIWLPRLEKDYRNLSLAVLHAQSDTEDLDESLRLMNAMFLFWQIRSYYQDGYTAIKYVLARKGADTPARAMGWYALAGMAVMNGSFDAALAACIEGIRLAQGNHGSDQSGLSRSSPGAS